MTRRILITSALACATHSAAPAQLAPTWITTIPTGSALTAGMTGMAVTPDGRSFLCGITGPSSNTDGIVAALGPAGNVLWTDTYNGPENWHDQLLALATGPADSLLAVGSTPGPGKYANVLLLKYDAATGSRLWAKQYSSGPGISESARAVAVDDAGNVYVGGSTVGDGTDCLVLKFDPAGSLLWKRTWDGPATAPYSQESVRAISLDPQGNPVIITAGVMNSLHPDYVVIKYDAQTGATLWESNWGLAGDDTPVAMAIDPAGDVYVTGTAFDFIDRIGTIRLDGATGALLWQAYDTFETRHVGRGLALDTAGGVYVTGSSDPEGNLSNFNDNFFTIKHDAATGAPLWTHTYGANCVGCYDVPGAVAWDPAGNVLVTGISSTAPFSNDLVLFVLDDQTGAPRDMGSYAGPPTQRIGGQRIALDADRNIYIGASPDDLNTGAVEMAVLRFPALPGACYPDCDQNATLDVFDFLCFTNAFNAADPYADCDGNGTLDLFDFLCFTNAFNTGCP